MFAIAYKYHQNNSPTQTIKKYFRYASRCSDCGQIPAEVEHFLKNVILIFFDKLLFRRPTTFENILKASIKADPQQSTNYLAKKAQCIMFNCTEKIHASWE